MSRMNNSFSSEEHQGFDQTDFLDDQYRYRDYLNSLNEKKYDARRVPQKHNNEQNIQLWNWPSDH